MTCQSHKAEAATPVAALGPFPNCSRCPCRPSDYSLTPAELAAEIQRCLDAGWGAWEVACRLVQPAGIGAAA